LASVGGRAVTYGDLNEQLKPAVNDLRLRIYEAERQAIDARINELLLDAEARRRRITRDDLIRVEIFDKLKKPTEADIAKFYEDNRARIPGGLEVARTEIANFLEQQSRASLEQALVERLRSTAQVRILLAEPAGYVQKISTDDDPSRGPLNAPVTVVMFTDFQCPACSATHPVLDEVLKQYGARVRLVVRDFPLDQHQWARKAAEAANAANAQGKFFEYIAILYKNQQALDVPSLKKYASDLGLDRARFDADLDSGKYAAEVAHDVADGKAYGIGSTPTIFINGVRLLGLGDRDIKAGLDRAFERAGQNPQAAR
jgi:protein-disulfide isomerase